MIVEVALVLDFGVVVALVVVVFTVGIPNRLRKGVTLAFVVVFRVLLGFATTIGVVGFATTAVVVGFATATGVIDFGVVVAFAVVVTFAVLDFFVLVAWMDPCVGKNP